MNQYSLKLLNKEMTSHNIVELRFERPSNSAFTAGQFVQFLIPDNGKETPRSYSIASTPKDSYFEFCIKLLPNGLASNFFSNIKVGESVNIRGPLGRFGINTKAERHVFVATSVGIAPIISIIRDELINKKSETPMHLLFGMRHREDIFYDEHFDMLSAMHENFTWTLTLSQPDESWAGIPGRVTEHLDRFTNASAAYYLCGNPEMVMEVRQKLIAKHIPPEYIHSEIF